jgi:hypothetical protein
MINEISPATAVLLASIASIAALVSTARALLKLPYLDDVEETAET